MKKLIFTILIFTSITSCKNKNRIIAERKLDSIEVEFKTYDNKINFYNKSFEAAQKEKNLSKMELYRDSCRIYLNKLIILNKKTLRLRDSLLIN